MSSCALAPAAKPGRSCAPFLFLDNSFQAGAPGPSPGKVTDYNEQGHSRKLSMGPSSRTRNRTAAFPSAGHRLPCGFLARQLGLGEVVRSAGGKEEVERRKEAEVGRCGQLSLALLEEVMT